MSRGRILIALAVAVLFGVVALGFALSGGRADPGGAYERALAAYEAGEMREARVELLNATQADPRDGRAWLLHARVLVEMRDGDGAALAVARARAAGVPAGETRAVLAEALLLQGKPDLALVEAGQPDISAGQAGEAARMRARAHLDRRDNAAAAQAFDEAVAIDPGNAALWVDVGRFRMGIGAVAGAVEAAGRAVAADPRDVDAMLLAGEAARSQYGLIAALPWFDRALAIDPDHLGVLIQKAATLGEAGRAREMLATTRHALEIAPGNPHLLYLLAVMAARAEDYDLARSLLRRLGDDSDDVAGVALLRGALDLQAGNYVLAAERLSALVERQPANFAAQRLLGAARFGAGDLQGAVATLTPLARRADAGSYVLILLGRAHERLGDRARAEAYLDRAATAGHGSSGPLAPESVSSADLAYFEGEARHYGGPDAETALIRVYLRLGRPEDALARADLLRRANPGLPAAHVLIGDSLAAMGRFADAARAYARAANIAFDEPVALRLIEALSRAGEPGEAHRALSLYLGQNPRSLPAARMAATLHMRAENWPSAAAILEGLRARIGDRDAALLADLAWSYHRSGEGERAQAFARRAYLLLPRSATAAERYGWIAFVNGDRRLGLELLVKARGLAPDNPVIRERLARAVAAVERARGS